MSEQACCPRCGSTEPSGGHDQAQSRQPDLGSPVDSLYEEVRRIRELAEDRGVPDPGHRIAELTREVRELQATVARLRATAGAGRRAR